MRRICWVFGGRRDGLVGVSRAALLFMIDSGSPIRETAPGASSRGYHEWNEAERIVCGKGAVDVCGWDLVRAISWLQFGVPASCESAEL